MFSNRRGITPLVATILLVAFSIGLGALVMSWGQDYVAQKADFAQGTAEVKSACDIAKIDIIKIAGKPQSCTSAQGVQLWIDNGADVDLVNIHARLLGDLGVDVQQDILVVPLLKGNAARAIVHPDPKIGNLRQIKLTPKIMNREKINLCAQNAITLEEFPACIG